MAAHFLTMLWREWHLWHRHASVGLTHIFVLLAAILLPFGLGPNLPLLRTLAPGLLWVIVLLAVFASLEHMFQSDAEDGSLDELRLMGGSYEQVALAKACGHWLAVLAPLAVSVPLAALLLNMEAAALGWLMAEFLCASPALSFLGSIGAALTLRVKRSGLLLGLIMMPFYLPLLIFALGGFGQAMSLMVLAGFSLAAVLLSPIAAAAGLRAAQQ